MTRSTNIGRSRCRRTPYGSASRKVLPERLEQVAQVPLAEDDEVVQALVSERFHETLRARLRRRRSGRIVCCATEADSGTGAGGAGADTGADDGAE
jgi:hypothetical protein